MSFEGYYQRLCKNGHCMNVDVYMEHADDKCTICGEGVAWSQLIDQTNDNGDEYYVYLQIKSERSCDHCGTVLERTYHIPKKRDL